MPCGSMRLGLDSNFHEGDMGGGGVIFLIVYDDLDAVVLPNAHAVV